MGFLSLIEGLEIIVEMIMMCIEGKSKKDEKDKKILVQTYEPQSSPQKF